MYSFDNARRSRLREQDIDAVYQYIIENRDNPHLGKIPGRILEQFGEYLEKANNGCPVA